MQKQKQTSSISNIYHKNQQKHMVFFPFVKHFTFEYLHCQTRVSDDILSFHAPIHQKDCLQSISIHDLIEKFKDGLPLQFNRFK